MFNEHIVPEPIAVKGAALEVVQKYVYLRQILQLGKNNFKKEARQRIHLENFVGPFRRLYRKASRRSKDTMFSLPSNLQVVRLAAFRKCIDYGGSPLKTCNNVTKFTLLAFKTMSSEISRRKHQVTYKPYVKTHYSDHDYKNMALKRPMSPHLTIYGPTVPAMTSILQRITGTMTTFYALLLAGGSLFLSNGIECYVSAIQSLDLSRPTIFLIKIILGAPFAYHYFCGIRFCAWNAGKWLAMSDVYGTAKKCFILTAIARLDIGGLSVLILMLHEYQNSSDIQVFARGNYKQIRSGLSLTTTLSQKDYYWIP
ncbi:uncharacterized protein ACR2FA_003237 [Aphomia sociella]